MSGSTSGPVDLPSDFDSESQSFGAGSSSGGGNFGNLEPNDEMQMQIELLRNQPSGSGQPGNFDLRQAPMVSPAGVAGSGPGVSSGFQNTFQVDGYAAQQQSARVLIFAPPQVPGASGPITLPRQATNPPPNFQMPHGHARRHSSGASIDPRYQTSSNHQGFVQGPPQFSMDAGPGFSQSAPSQGFVPPSLPLPLPQLNSFTDPVIPTYTQDQPLASNAPHDHSYFDPHVQFDPNASFPPFDDMPLSSIPEHDVPPPQQYFTLPDFLSMPSSTSAFSASASAQTLPDASISDHPQPSASTSLPFPVSGQHYQTPNPGQMTSSGPPPVIPPQHPPPPPPQSFPHPPISFGSEDFIPLAGPPPASTNPQHAATAAPQPFVPSRPPLLQSDSNSGALATISELASAAARRPGRGRASSLQQPQRQPQAGPSNQQQPVVDVRRLSFNTILNHFMASVSSMDGASSTMTGGEHFPFEAQQRPSLGGMWEPGPMLPDIPEYASTLGLQSDPHAFSLFMGHDVQQPFHSSEALVGFQPHPVQTAEHLLAPDPSWMDGDSPTPQFENLL